MIIVELNFVTICQNFAKLFKIVLNGKLSFCNKNLHKKIGYSISKLFISQNIIEFDLICRLCNYPK